MKLSAQTQPTTRRVGPTHLHAEDYLVNYGSSTEDHTASSNSSKDLRDHNSCHEEISNGYNSDEDDSGSDEDDSGSDEDDSGSDEDDSGSDEDDSGSDEDDSGSDEDDSGSDEDDSGSDEDDSGSDEDDSGSDEDDSGSDEDDLGSNDKKTGSDQEYLASDRDDFSPIKNKASSTNANQTSLAIKQVILSLNVHRAKYANHNFGSDEDEDPLTSDFSSFSGSDDNDFSQISDSDCITSSDSTNNLSHNGLKQSLLAKLLAQGHQGPRIIQILKEVHGIQNISLRTLSWLRQMWELQHKDLQNVPPPPLLPQIQASILSSHAKGLNLVEIQARLPHEVQLQVSISTVKRYLRRLGIKSLANDIADGRVTMERVFKAVEHAQRSLLHNNAGYQRMQTILMRQYSIRIPR
ncbi:hypothetical protein PGTUg99_018025 [Puccinia graminis f. sp. tritici]|nr:hypothetical protein PGTUg99_018025 [Puccinia graminis f. sp. tritici]